MLILIAGNPKTGKTISALSFPRPTLVLDFDDGIKSMYHTKDESDNLVVENQDRIRVIKLTKKEVYSINFKTVMKNGSCPSYTAESGEVLGKYDEIIGELSRNDGVYEGVKYKTIIVDSLSAMFILWQEAVMLMSNIPHLRIQDYGTMQSILFGAYIPPLKALPVEFVILNAHVATETDKDKRVLGQMPVAPSYRQGKAMMATLDEIWLQQTELGKRMWFTKPEGYFEAGSRMDLPSPVEANYNSIKSKLDEGVKLEAEIRNKIRKEEERVANLSDEERIRERVAAELAYEES